MVDHQIKEMLTRLQARDQWTREMYGPELYPVLLPGEDLTIPITARNWPLQGFFGDFKLHPWQQEGLEILDAEIGRMVFTFM